jgi:cyanophycinase
MKVIISLASVWMLASANMASACITVESENNNRESQANGPLCSGVLLEGDIDSSRDKDWYKFSTAAAGTINIELDHASNDDFDWALYQSSGPAVASGATSNVPETGSFDGPAGDYFIKVSYYRGTGYYDLTVDFADDSGGNGEPACTTYGSRPAKPNNLSAEMVGSADDVCPQLDNQAGLLLMGGGTDVDAAFSQRIKPKIKGGDIVVLRTSGTAAYNDYLQGLTDANSVETIIIDTTTKANSDYVDWAIRSAEFVWIAGGDQSDYLNQWQNTKVQAAIDHVYQKHGAIGGTSAGNAVQSQYIYDPDGVSGAVSDEVVLDFCDASINISSGFLSTPIMQNVLTDTHFAERDRMGRMGVFLATIGSGKRAIGVSEATSIYFTENGQGVVDGANNVYVLATDNQTNFSQTQCGQPVIINDLLNYTLQPGDLFNLTTGSSNVSPARLNIDGRNSSYYSPTNPY